MKISVVIPVRNEAGSIRLLLDSLLSQSRQPDEILITDGGSSDATPLILEEYAQRNPKVRLFRETNALPGRGRNIGAASASHEWLAFIDAGVSPAPDWLAELAAYASEHPRLRSSMAPGSPWLTLFSRSVRPSLMRTCPPGKMTKGLSAREQFCPRSSVALCGKGWRFSRATAIRGRSLVPE